MSSSPRSYGDAMEHGPTVIPVPGRGGNAAAFPFEKETLIGSAALFGMGFVVRFFSGGGLFFSHSAHASKCAMPYIWNRHGSRPFRKRNDLPD